MCDGKCVSEENEKRKKKKLVINGTRSIFSGEAKNFSTFHELCFVRHSRGLNVTAFAYFLFFSNVNVSFNLLCIFFLIAVNVCHVTHRKRMGKRMKTKKIDKNIYDNKRAIFHNSAVNHRLAAGRNGAIFVK
jgi:hypothetical protein